jgi:hypothetical protein
MANICADGEGGWSKTNRCSPTTNTMRICLIVLSTTGLFVFSYFYVSVMTSTSRLEEDDMIAESLIKVDFMISC